MNTYDASLALVELRGIIGSEHVAEVRKLLKHMENVRILENTLDGFGGDDSGVHEEEIL